MTFITALEGRAQQCIGGLKSPYSGTRGRARLSLNEIFPERFRERVKSKLEASVNRGERSNGLRSLYWVAIVAALFAGMTFAPRHAAAQGPVLFTVPFSADQTLTSIGRSGAPVTITGKVYIGKARMRTDMNSTQAGNVAIIMNLETKETIMLMIDRKMAMKMSNNGMMGGRGMQMKPPVDTSKPFDPAHPCADSSDMTCKIEGNETINGRECQKWVMTKKSDGKVSTAWIDMKLHYPIKAVSDSGTLELRNVVEGAQPDDLFEVPPGFTVMDPGAMMGGRN